uniref:Requim, req/dpf2, putative n=1 Tax=Ixodes scapularis TaxID=6945 RepID=A0A1S4L2G6_IXOSC
MADPAYKDAMESSSSANTRLVVERRLRLPFLDAQTGVAQSDCALWMPRWQRMPGHGDGQLYSYPARRWRKKRRQYLMNDRYLGAATRLREPDYSDADLSPESAATVAGFVTHIPLFRRCILQDRCPFQVSPRWQPARSVTRSLFPDFPDDPETDTEDYDETYTRKKKKKGKVGPGTGQKKRTRIEYTDAEKPYSCESECTCFLDLPVFRIQTRKSHFMEHSPWRGCASSRTASSPFSRPRRDRGPGSRSASGKPLANPSPYCDFCLGDNGENKKTRQPEELVSCSDCGRSAHPSCLQFTPNMTVSVKKYRWQCIECKSCGLCGTSDNDDQLLFCDDCDRGYHMYCLTPPLSEPPEGLWSCHLCIEEYGNVEQRGAGPSP